MKSVKIFLCVIVLMFSFSAIGVNAAPADVESTEQQQEMPEGEMRQNGMGGGRMRDGMPPGEMPEGMMPPERPDGMTSRAQENTEQIPQENAESTPAAPGENTEQTPNTEESGNQRFQRGGFGAEGQMPPEFEGGFQGRPWGNMEQQTQKEEEAKPFFVKNFDLIISCAVLIFGFLFVIFFRKKNL